MTGWNRWNAGLFAMLYAAVTACVPRADAQPQGPAVRTVQAQALPQMDGSRLEVRVVEVAYGPGGASAAHRHPCAVFGFVLAGSLRTRVEGRPEVIVKAGESFYEEPNAAHVVSANASSRDSAKFVVHFVCDRSGPLTIPIQTTGKDR